VFIAGKIKSNISKRNYTKKVTRYFFKKSWIQ